MLDKYCISETYTINEAISQFERNNDRVAIVINQSNKVIGVISQGDILRAISGGVEMYAPINQIIKNSFLHLYKKDLNAAYNIFKLKKITLLPIINDRNELIDVITLDDIFVFLENDK